MASRRIIVWYGLRASRLAACLVPGLETDLRPNHTKPNTDPRDFDGKIWGDQPDPQVIFRAVT